MLPDLLEQVRAAEEVLNELYKKQEELEEKIFIAELNLTRLERELDKENK